MGVRGRKPKRDRSVVPAGTWFPAYMNARMECTSGLASRGGTAAVQGLAGQEKRKSARAISSGRRWRALGTRELSSGLCLAIVLPYLRPCSRYVRSQSACVKLCWQVGAALLLQGFRFEQVNEQRQEKPRRRVNLAPECIAGKMNRHEAGGGPRGLGTNCEWAGARGRGGEPISGEQPRVPAGAPDLPAGSGCHTASLPGATCARPHATRKQERMLLRPFFFVHDINRKENSGLVDDRSIANPSTILRSVPLAWRSYSPGERDEIKRMLGRRRPRSQHGCASYTPESERAFTSTPTGLLRRHHVGLGMSGKSCPRAYRPQVWR